MLNLVEVGCFRSYKIIHSGYRIGGSVAEAAALSLKRITPGLVGVKAPPSRRARIYRLRGDCVIQVVAKSTRSARRPRKAVAAFGAAGECRVH